MPTCRELQYPLCKGILANLATLPFHFSNEKPVSGVQLSEEVCYTFGSLIIAYNLALHTFLTAKLL